MNKIDKQIVEDIVSKNLENNFLKKIKNNIYLRDKEIDILIKNGINYMDCNDLSILIYMIEEKLNQEYDDELELLSNDLSERNYYQNTNK